MDQGWSLEVSLIAMLAAALVIGIAGTRLSRLADRLADRTGLGEAVVGAVLLGGATSLPGITASVTAAMSGYPVMALANAFGGIAAQTAFLAIADLAFPKINLEHAAAEIANITQGALLVSLLSVLALAMLGPPISFFGIHPATWILIGGYLFGTRLIYRAHIQPMWRPRMTRETRPDEPAETPEKESLRGLWLGFLTGAILVMAAGWVLTRAGASLTRQTGLSESLVGGVLIAVTTSLPELVTSIAAVRRGAVTLAVGGILGGNTFDTLFAAVADIAYRPGSIYEKATVRETALVLLTIMMTGILLLGLLHREKRGFANIGFESILVLILYLLGMAGLRYYG